MFASYPRYCLMYSRTAYYILIKNILILYFQLHTVIIFLSLPLEMLPNFESGFDRNFCFTNMNESCVFWKGILDVIRIMQKSNDIGVKKGNPNFSSLSKINFLFIPLIHSYLSTTQGVCSSQCLLVKLIIKFTGIKHHIKSHIRHDVISCSLAILYFRWEFSIQIFIIFLLVLFI